MCVAGCGGETGTALLSVPSVAPPPAFCAIGRVALVGIGMRPGPAIGVAVCWGCGGVAKTGGGRGGLSRAAAAHLLRVTHSPKKAIIPAMIPMASGAEDVPVELFELKVAILR